MQNFLFSSSDGRNIRLIAATKILIVRCIRIVASMQPSLHTIFAFTRKNTLKIRRETYKRAVENYGGGGRNFSIRKVHNYLDILVYIAQAFAQHLIGVRSARWSMKHDNSKDPFNFAFPFHRLHLSIFGALPTLYV